MNDQRSTRFDVDEIDRSLLNALTADGRAAWSALAAVVGLTPVAVARRVHRLIDVGSVRIQAIVNPIALGVGRAAGVVVTTRGPMMPVAERLAARPETTFVAIAAGSDEIHAEVRVVDAEHLVMLLDEIRDDAQVERVMSLPYIRIAKEAFSRTNNVGVAGPMQFDEIDFQLFERLEADGRASYADLARELSLSAPSVRARVQRHLSSGAIAIAAFTRPLLSDESTNVAVMVRVHTGVAEVLERIAELPDIIFAAAALGRAEVVANALVEDREHLLRLTDSVRILPGVAHVTALEYIAVVKEDYSAVGLATAARLLRNSSSSATPTDVDADERSSDVR